MRSEIWQDTDMLVIFDSDGTLVGGEVTDWSCFNGALYEVAGVVLTPAFWETLPEVTASSIVHHALPGCEPGKLAELEKAVQRRYLERLQREHQVDDGVFHPIGRAREVFKRMCQEERYDVAIATGDWHGSNTFKLTAAGFEVDRIPRATSSDRFRRADIIRMAAERAGRSLDEAVYVGDGEWDYRATCHLGIPFIGVGGRHASLRKAGAKHLMEEWEEDRFLALLEGLRG